MFNTLNAAALKLNENSEQCRLVAYDDLDPFRTLKPGDRIRGRLTIGWGHTGPEVHLGLTWTQAEADQAKIEDLAFAQQVVRKYVKVPLTNNQFGALVDFVFNVGIGNFLKSGVLKAVNAGRRDLVPAQLMLWVKAGGKTLSGLVTRRALEANLWKTPDALEPPMVAEPAPAPSIAPDAPGLLDRVAVWLKAHA